MARYFTESVGYDPNADLVLDDAGNVVKDRLSASRIPHIEKTHYISDGYKTINALIDAVAELQRAVIRKVDKY